MSSNNAPTNGTQSSFINDTQPLTTSASYSIQNLRQQVMSPVALAEDALFVKLSGATNFKRWYQNTVLDFVPLCITPLEIEHVGHKVTEFGFNEGA